MEDKLEKLKKKNDLSDIILEKDDSNGENIKKLLLGAASLVLLFLIVLIVMKMFNNSDISPSENPINIKEEISIDDSKLDISSMDDSLPSALFKEEPIIDETTDTDLKFEEMVRRLKQQDVENQSTNDEPKDLVTINNDEKDRNIINKIKEATSNQVKQSSEKVINQVKPQIISQPKPKTIIKPIEVTKTKTITIQQEPVRTTVVTPYPISAISGYFIQVGATYNSFPNKSFLSKIKNSGYDYIVHKTSIKGRDIKKVLVGPYTTRDQARNDLVDVQTKINPSAYIYRIR